MTALIQPLSAQVNIVDEQGRPTPQFIRILQKLSLGTGLSKDAAGNITFATQAAKTILANKTAGIASPTACTIDDILDFVAGTAAQGDILYRSSTGYKRLAAGTAGQFLKTNGPGADPTWAVAGGSSWDFSPPISTIFTLVSGDATNLALADDADVGLLISSNTPINASLVWRYAYKTLTNKALDWTLITKIRRQLENRQYHGGGVSFMDSVSGKITHFDLRFDGTSTINVANYSNLTTFSSSSYSQNAGAGQVFEWQRVRHTGGNYLFDFSPDGKQWANLVTVGDTSFLTNRADRVGITAYSTTNTPSLMTCGYWSLTGPGV